MGGRPFCILQHSFIHTTAKRSCQIWRSRFPTGGFSGFSFTCIASLYVLLQYIYILQVRAGTCTGRRNGQVASLFMRNNILARSCGQIAVGIG